MAATGLIFKVQKFSIHDGPGIRTLVFLKGCPLSCIWCCNPESQNPRQEILFIKQKCTRCEKCLTVCSSKAIKVDDHGNRTMRRESCDLCLKCVDVCSPNAMELLGKGMSVRDIMELIEQDRPFYTVSDGGVTLSGGEPTLQFQFSKELLRECRTKRIHTAIETSGCCDWRILRGLSTFTDLFLYDIKVVDRKKHFMLTGVFNDLILKNLERLIKSRKRIVIRYPLVPRNNDKKEDLDALVDLVLELNARYHAIDELDLLPYHRYGVHKYDLLGINYRLRSLAPHTNSKISKISKNLSKRLGISVKVGG